MNGRLARSPVYSLFVVVLLSCADDPAAAPDCMVEGLALAASAAVDSVWHDRLLTYVETHEPEDTATFVITPESGLLQNAVVEAGGTVVHVFQSFNGFLSFMRVADLPRILEIEGIVNLTFGALGEQPGSCT